MEIGTFRDSMGIKVKSQELKQPEEIENQPEPQQIHSNVWLE